MRTMIILLMLVPSAGNAGWLEDAALFAGGLVAGLAVHELGHELAARAYGERLTWSARRGTLQLNCRSPCEERIQVSAAGNVATALVGEMLLHMPYRNVFVDGMQTFNTLNPIFYAYKDSTTPGGYSDYAHTDDRLQIVLAIHAASIGYRHVADGRWRVGATARTVNFSIDF